MFRQLIGLILCCLFSTPLIAQTREEKVRNDRKKVESAGVWIYGDFSKAVAQAKETRKPIIAVLRCIPCEECVKLDDEIIDADERIKPLLEKFVRVRIVSTNGLDLSLFQFDTDQSFAVFFLNADGTIYGRFGTRSHRTNWVGDVSVDGLAKAMTGALALHQGYPGNKDLLAAKRGPKPEFPRPETIPSLSSKYKSTIDYEGKVVPSCIHCHQVGEAQKEVYFSRKETLPESTLYPYPHPKTLGLVLDPKEMATVKEITKESHAAKAGLRTGDILSTMAGQPLISIADIQWVLHRMSHDGGDIPVEVLREGQLLNLNLKLEKGWKQKGDLSWRASTWSLRRKALGGMLLVDLPGEDRAKLGITDDQMALLVQHVGQYPPHNVAQKAGFTKGDILLGFDGRTDLKSETGLITYSLWEKKPGDKIPVDILRGTRKQQLLLPLPE